MVPYTDIDLVLLFETDIDFNQKTGSPDSKRQTTADVHQQMITRQEEATTYSSGEDGVDESWIGREEKENEKEKERDLNSLDEEITGNNLQVQNVNLSPREGNDMTEANHKTEVPYADNEGFTGDEDEGDMNSDNVANAAQKKESVGAGTCDRCRENTRLKKLTLFSLFYKIIQVSTGKTGSLP